MALLLFVISGLLATPWKAPNYFSLIVGLARSSLRNATVNLASMSSSDGNVSGFAPYAWDNLNQLSTVADNRLSGQNTTTYVYDAASNLVTATYPDGLESTFNYDQLNRLTSMPASTTAYMYELGPTGNCTSAMELADGRRNELELRRNLPADERNHQLRSRQQQRKHQHRTGPRCARRPLPNPTDHSLESLVSPLRSNGYSAESYSSAEQFWESGTFSRTSSIITAVEMRQMSDLDLLQYLKNCSCTVPVVLITGEPSAPFCR